MKIGNYEVVIDRVAQSPKEQGLGLSFVDRLEPGHGILFPFHDVAPRIFHTRGMKFPIDMICISENRCVHIERNVIPDISAVYLPACKMVLEVNGKESDSIDSESFTKSLDSLDWLEKKGKIYLQPGEEPPKGVRIKIGVRGGRYYDEPAPTVLEIAGNIWNKHRRELHNLKNYADQLPQSEKMQLLLQYPKFHAFMIRRMHAAREQWHSAVKDYNRERLWAGRPSDLSDLREHLELRRDEARRNLRELEDLRAVWRKLRSSAKGKVENKPETAAEKLSDSSVDRTDEHQSKMLAEVVSSRHLGGGCHPTYKLELSNRLHGVWKPKSGERNIRYSVPKGTFYLRERLAYEIDRAIGWNYVPPTVVRYVGDEIGSLQTWKKGDSFHNSRVSDEDHVRMSIFDFIIGNADRHTGNVLKDKTNRVVAIDNGTSFALDPSEIKLEAFNMFKVSFGGDVSLRYTSMMFSPASAKMIAYSFHRIDSMDWNPVIERVSEQIGEEAATRMKERISFVSKAGKELKEVLKGKPGSDSIEIGKLSSWNR